MHARRNAWLIALATVLLALVVLPSLLERFLFHPPQGEQPIPRGVTRVEYGEGEKRVGYFHRAERAGRGTVLYFHGNATNASEAGELAAALTRQGFDFLAAEYRGYGSSAGRSTPAGILEDGDEAYRFLTVARQVPPDDIVVWGHSLGGAVAAHVATKHRVRACVLASTFVSLHTMAKYLFGIEVSRVIPSAYLLDTGRLMSKLHVPTLVFHGDADETIPAAQSQTLFSMLAGDKKKLVIIAGGEHSMFWEATAPGVVAFLDQYVPPARP